MRELSWASEAEIIRALELLREAPAEAPANLPDLAMDSVHAAIASADMMELATSVMVQQFICPVLDMIVFVLGVADHYENGSPDGNV